MIIFTMVIAIVVTVNAVFILSMKSEITYKKAFSEQAYGKFTGTEPHEIIEDGKKKYHYYPRYEYVINNVTYNHVVHEDSDPHKVKEFVIINYMPDNPNRSRIMDSKFHFLYRYNPYFKIMVLLVGSTLFVASMYHILIV